MKIFLSIVGMAVAFSAQASSPAITQMITPVIEKNGKVVSMPQKRSVAPAPKALENAATVQRLDSVVGFNSDGSKGNMQRFVYDDNGWWSETHYYYWDAASQSWGEPVQSVIIDRMPNGYVLSERNMYMGYGVRNDYEYDAKNRGVMMISYTINEGDAEWTPGNKGEYEYDDNDNIIEEMVSYYDAAEGKWVNANHNFASWDEKGRQTSIDTYFWNGSEWELTTKLEYEWYNGPYDPDYIEGTEKERLSYRLEYMKFEGEWLPVFVTENYFNEDGRVSGQSHKYYNREFDNYYGGDNYNGMLTLCNSWISELGYDDLGIQNVSKTFQYVPGTDEKLFELGHCTFDREYQDNGDFIDLVTNEVNSYDDDGNITGSRVVDMTWYAYNASGKKLWCYEEMPSYTGEFIPMLEDKWAYDENNRLIENVSYDFNGDIRNPAMWTSFTYDEDGNQIEVIGRARKTSGGGGGILPMGVSAKRESVKSGLTDRDYQVGEDDERESWTFTNKWTFEWQNGVQTQKLGYRWDGDDWINFQGQNNLFDFSVSLDEMMVPEAYVDPYKIDYIEQLHGYGDDWLVTRMQYYYSDVINTSVSCVEAEYGMAFSDNTIYSLAGDSLNVTVFDISGKKVVEAAGSSVSLSHLAKGVYVVKAEMPGATKSLKVRIR